MWKTLVDNIVSRHWGDVASVAGLLIVIVGFVITIVNTRSSRRAAEAAQDAVHDMKENLRRMNTVAEFSEAITIMHEIKRLHRGHAWNTLPDRYSTLRKLLISIRSSNHQLSEDEQASLQNAMMHIRGFEDKIEKLLAVAGASTPDVAKLNSIVSDQIDRLSAVLVSVRDGIGR